MNKYNLKSGLLFATIIVITMAALSILFVGTVANGQEESPKVTSPCETGPFQPAGISPPEQWDGATSISEGWIVRHPFISSFSASVFTHPCVLYSALQVELRRFEEPFTGVDDGGIFTSDPVLSGQVARIPEWQSSCGCRPPILLPDGKYHWRARAVDNQGNASPWVEFGVAGNVDFEILTPLPLSPAQLAAEPLVVNVLPLNKKIARIIVDFYEDPLNQAAGNVVRGGTLLLCVGDIEIFSKFLFCATKWGVEKGAVAFTNYVIKKNEIAILEDPPRDDYDIVAKVKPAKPDKPVGKTALDSATSRYLTTLRRQADLLEAVRITMERLQGAFLADKGRFMLLQGATLHDLTERLRDNHEHQAEVAKQISTLIDKNWNGELNLWFSRIINVGFSPEERRAFLEAGFTPEEIDGLEAEFASIAQAGDYLPSMLAYFENEATAAESAAQGFQDALATIDSSLDKLLSAVCPGTNDINECLENQAGME